jgi:peptidoglycan/LPS O-acetylase OafA/YrhL
MRSLSGTATHTAVPALRHEGGFQPEIQGLRAFAVLVVVCAHAGLAGFAGGFIGVDVFFVISGFLITQLLLAEFAETGRIDLLAFWARRARRLLPNAYACLLGTLLLALLLFPGYDPASLAREVGFSALQYVNYYFADKAVDYFQSDTPASPVLHFWSLAVEEQFYAVWPLLLLGIGAAFKNGFLRAATILLVLAWGISFVASVLLTESNQPLAYFSLGTRCWQLATGGLLAVGWSRVEQLPSALRLLMAWLGAAAVVAGVFLIAEGPGYPGLPALIPTLGTAAVLAGFGGAPSGGVLRRALCLPLMQWLGARSYSWYLWHWPLLALPRIAYPESASIEIVAIPLSLAIGGLAYRWIEMPARYGRFLPARPLPTLAAAVAGLALVTVCTHLYKPALMVTAPALAARYRLLETAATEQTDAEKDKCHLGRKRETQSDCLYGNTSGARSMALFGDSHAVHWFEPVNAAAKQMGWQLRAWSKSICPSADLLMAVDGRPYTSCRRWYETRMERLTGPDGPDLVVLSNATEYGNSVLDPLTGAALTGGEEENVIRQGFRSTISKLLKAGVAVVVIRDVPYADDNYRTCFIAGGDCTMPQARALRRPDAAAAVALEFAGQVQLIDFTDIFCPGEECAIARDGMMVYRDRTHLSSAYARTFTSSIFRHLQDIAARLPENRLPDSAVSTIVRPLGEPSAQD